MCTTEREFSQAAPATADYEYVAIPIRANLAVGWELNTGKR